MDLLARYLERLITAGDDGLISRQAQGVWLWLTKRRCIQRREPTPFSAIEEIIEDFKAGKMVIMVDDENRENEGDLIMAAERVRPEDINYMARYGRGLICLTLTRERCSQLRLPLMVSETDEHHANEPSRFRSKPRRASQPVSPHTIAHGRCVQQLRRMHDRST